MQGFGVFWLCSAPRPIHSSAAKNTALPQLSGKAIHDHFVVEPLQNRVRVDGVSECIAHEVEGEYGNDNEDTWDKNPWVKLHCANVGRSIQQL